MSVPLLQAESVRKSFGGVVALRDGGIELHSGSIHALCGGNGAGKSTFLSILMGILRRDGGQIRLRGQEVDFRRPDEALKAGIAIITQELSPVPGMTVAENIFLGREPRQARFVVDHRSLEKQAATLLGRLEFDIDPRWPMARLSLAQTQLVEIAKAFGREAGIIIMDEPTSAIGEHETETLFRAMRSATFQGAGIIYVSHRLSEIFAIADRYTVFRDGSRVDNGRITDIDRSTLVRQIVGREIAAGERRSAPGRGDSILEVDGLTRHREFEDISLSVAAGEVVGIYGLLGSGRSEFVNCVFGLTRPDSGSIRLRGTRLASGDPHASIRTGLALVTEDRKESGLVLSAPVAENITLSALPSLSPLAVINRRAESGLVRTMIERLQIRLASPAMRVSGLSGGNQQKVVLARCLSTQPSCLLCDEPTRGIDVGAKREVHRFMAEFAAEGGAVLAISSETPEVLEFSDRIAVFRRGRLVAVIDGHSASQEELLHLAS